MVFKDRGTQKTLAEVHLHHGMLAVMGPGFQKRYLHGIPRRKTHVDRCGKRVPSKGTRISFTFRSHKLRAQ
jgi:alkylated DNA repair dioxygenase AlkB